MIKKMLLDMVMLLVLLETAPAQYPGWKHSGSVYLLTTPEGANLPASASEDGFPLLVRLHKDFFNFSQAKANGEDIRFSTSTGTPLAYQIEEWDAANGTNKVNKFNPVNSSRVRLSIGSVSSATPSICEFETHLDDGPNLNHSDSLVVQNGEKGSRTIYLNSPNASNLQQALDNAVKVYDVEFENNAKLRYIHKIKDRTDIYFFANIGNSAVDTYTRLRGKLMMEAWDPHSGQSSVPEYTNTVEDDSLFIVANRQ
jgi:hypothetical protein